MQSVKIGLYTFDRKVDFENGWILESCDGIQLVRVKVGHDAKNVLATLLYAVYAFKCYAEGRTLFL